MLRWVFFLLFAIWFHIALNYFPIILLLLNAEAPRLVSELRAAWEKIMEKFAKECIERLKKNNSLAVDGFTGHAVQCFTYVLMIHILLAFCVFVCYRLQTTNINIFYHRYIRELNNFHILCMNIKHKYFQLFVSHNYDYLLFFPATCYCLSPFEI